MFARALGIDSTVEVYDTEMVLGQQRGLYAGVGTLDVEGVVASGAGRQPFIQGIATGGAPTASLLDVTINAWEGTVLQLDGSTDIEDLRVIAATGTVLSSASGVINVSGVVVESPSTGPLFDLASVDTSMVVADIEDVRVQGAPLGTLGDQTVVSMADVVVRNSPCWLSKGAPKYSLRTHEFSIRLMQPWRSAATAW